jgi:hypothetical protein
MVMEQTERDFLLDQIAEKRKAIKVYLKMVEELKRRVDYSQAEHLREMMLNGVLRFVLSKVLKGCGDTPCRFDHHGNCQEHFLENPCSVAEARGILKNNPAPLPADGIQAAQISGVCHPGGKGPQGEGH